jgi:midasin (ATPase involved in ribosome maturation)
MTEIMEKSKSTSARAKAKGRPGGKSEDGHARHEESRSDCVDWGLVERVLASRKIRIVYLWGPPGTGKTYCALRSGDACGGAYAWTLTEDTPASELRGNWLPQGDALVWEDGPATAAMREGRWLVLNEVSRASEDTLSFLYGILESSETARITLPTRETIRPAEGYRVVVTDNHAPDTLPEALQDRLEAVLEIREPHPDAIARLSPDLREAALRSFDLEADRRVSVRSWLYLDAARRDLGLRDACSVVFGPQRGSQIYDALSLTGSL